MQTCHLCQSQNVVEQVDFGMQPVCNRYLTHSTDNEYTHPLVLVQCQTCGLVQLQNPLPPGEIKPRYDWITYNEPEGHLDKLVEIIVNLPGITPNSSIGSLSFKDDSTLQRLNKLGFKQTWRLDSQKDLNIHDPRASIETIRDIFKPPIIAKIINSYGQPDIVIARHIIEHGNNIIGFLKALKQLIKPNGYIVIEVPDSVQFLENHDCSPIWEEHIVYFTPETFKNSFSIGHFSLVKFENFPYALENSLIGIAQPTDIDESSLTTTKLEEEISRSLFYAQGVLKRNNALRQTLFEYQQKHGKIALFGAGHVGCMFINLVGLTDIIEFVVDDDPHKKNLLMPGSQLPIYESCALLDKNIKLCLLTLSPESEKKVLENNQAFIKKGGTFASIFLGDKLALNL
ncbi:MAG: SAM-dependent methyltransferase [Candidatus Parabeggiatoa sp. nov. 1]|nr:MAG: SAM-dependent methyltransferase [Gammaproteobacteria bacterium]